MSYYIVSLLVGNLVGICVAQHNLSPFGNVSQSSIYKNNSALFGPQNAVNEPISNEEWSQDKSEFYCTHTAEHHSYNWWKIEFQSIVHISSVDIFYRNHFQSRMDGFRLSVTNDPSNVNGSEVCFKDKKDGRAKITQTVDCHRIGKVLLYDKYTSDNYYNRPFIELCYLRIKGCFYGYWGPECNATCPNDCVGGNCFPENGTCVWGSLYENLAFNSFASQVPKNTKYPASTVVDGNRTKSCTKINGSDARLQIDLQQISVVSIIYINFEDVPVNVPFDIYASNSSFSEIGNSMSSVYRGTKSLLVLPDIVITRFLIFVPGSHNGQKMINICEFEARGCVAGMFGSSCNISCPENCIGACDLKTGRCIFGCGNGWRGNHCDQACNMGYFGHDCLRGCSQNCLNSTCDHVTGACYGCNKGWTSYNCTEECGTGRYGSNCSETCDGCVFNECDRFNGLCTNTTSCKPGFLIDDKCAKACDDWTFGYNCSEVCHCRTKPCDIRNGTCEKGCDKGWKTETCNTKCSSDGSYGYNCERTCSTCVNMTCEAIDGNCTHGCIAGFSGSSCQLNSQALEDSAIKVGIVGGGIAAILLLLVVVLGFMLIRRRSASRKPKRERGESMTEFNKLNTIADHPHTSTDQYENIPVKCNKLSESFTKNEGFANFGIELDARGNDEETSDVYVYGNVSKEQSNQHYKISIEELEITIKEKRKNNGFLNEFELLPKGPVHPHSEGLKEINRNKNRFKTTWPYDHSRVILKGDSKHDYINASFIDSYTKEKAYIASQGPKNNTVKDFWHMIWQEGVGTIVMVTNLEEEGKSKCDQYWPSEINTPMELDAHTLVMMSETRHSIYDHRCLLMSDKKKIKQTEVHHFHFTQWPDYGVPDIVKLVTFYRKVKTHSNAQDGPLLVHCSAGIGRTGTFIAIDALYSHGKTTGEVDVMEYVQIMRRDRMNMLQTHEQYTAVFEALLELFTIPVTSIPTSDFCKIVEEQEETLPSNQKMYRKQFQKLHSLRPAYTDDLYSASVHPKNIMKNSDSSILAHDSYRPYLMSFAGKRTDYINAVIISGFLEANGFLVTQCPLQSTVVDFWTMVYDHDCELVVLLDDFNLNAQIWPDEEAPLVFEIFNVYKENDISDTDVCVILENKKNKERRKVNILTYNEWYEETFIPTSTYLLIDFYKKMKEYEQKCTGKITVACRDGCSKCGLYVAVCLVLEKMGLDNEIDIFQIVRNMQIRRPEFFTRSEQYEFCYSFVKDCLMEEESVYANT